MAIIGPEPNSFLTSATPMIGGSSRGSGSDDDDGGGSGDGGGGGDDDDNSNATTRAQRIKTHELARDARL